MLRGKRFVGIGFLVLAGLAACRPSAAQADPNLLVNGDFSAGNTGFSTGYTYSPGNIYPEASYDVVNNPHNDHSLANSYGDHTTGNGLMLALNGADSATTPAWSETVSIVQSGEYLFTGDLSSWSQGYGPIARLELVINGSDVGEIDAPVAGGTWMPFGEGWNAGEATQATITIYDLETATGGNDFSLDDLSFSHIAVFDTARIAAPAPAPAMATLVGFAAIAAYKFRRRALANA